MIYTEALPRLKDIRNLAAAVKQFPASRETISEIAIQNHYDISLIHFLELFPEDEIFDSRDDFLERSEEIEFLLKEKRAMPEEDLLGPQD